ncbi:hypothetical protein QFZ56_003413 [Streptomyces achromogenes]|uniref:DUF4396 domain-containing protein n=1 Tax=Streptomyces achromogenes TaxID=67255 RepID=A0ABU0Q3L7_STRAH|nr:DUF4396 domain-containing protein [Streptomyces achromogenes]MDQ0684450.1 hypothetical protein [Streptomyces achromogenes]
MSHDDDDDHDEHAEPPEHDRTHRHDHSGGHEQAGGHVQAGRPGHHSRPRGHASWAMAVTATLHCLTGCAVGEILGMVIGTALGWGNVPTMVVAILLAFLFGYSLTLLSVRRAGLDLRAAVRVALAADTVSIAVMELVDNAIVAFTPGAMDAQLSDGLFWAALLGGFVAAFLITTPVNKWMIARGKGHAVAHTHAHG